MSRIKKIKAELVYYKTLAVDPRTPAVARWLLAAALAYLAMPFDLIPDFIPLLGQLDDLLVVPLLLWLAIRCIPNELKRKIRAEVFSHVDTAL